MNMRRIALKAALTGALLLAGTAVSLAASAEATSSVNVRQGPGTQYGVVDQLYAGEEVDVQGCQGGWCRIEHSGQDGWVSANYLSRGGYSGDDYYDNGPDIIIRAPRYHRPLPPPPRYYRPYRHSRPYYDNSFCFGGNNAQFCIGN